jgi:hypothetical protein
MLFTAKTTFPKYPDRYPFIAAPSMYGKWVLFNVFFVFVTTAFYVREKFARDK